jgi:hypothetical protein
MAVIIHGSRRRRRHQQGSTDEVLVKKIIVSVYFLIKENTGNNSGDSDKWRINGVDLIKLNIDKWVEMYACKFHGILIAAHLSPNPMVTGAINVVFYLFNLA